MTSLSLFKMLKEYSTLRGGLTFLERYGNRLKLNIVIESWGDEKLLVVIFLRRHEHVVLTLEEPDRVVRYFLESLVLIIRVRYYWFALC